MMTHAEQIVTLLLEGPIRIDKKALDQVIQPLLRGVEALPFDVNAESMEKFKPVVQGMDIPRLAYDSVPVKVTTKLDSSGYLASRKTVYISWATLWVVKGHFANDGAESAYNALASVLTHELIHAEQHKRSGYRSLSADYNAKYSAASQDLVFRGEKPGFGQAYYDDPREVGAYGGQFQHTSNEKEDPWELGAQSYKTHASPEAYKKMLKYNYLSKQFPK